MTIADDKTIYFVLGDMDTPEVQDPPQTEDAKKSLLQAYVSLFKDFLGDSGKTITDEAISHLSEVQLKSMADRIGQAMAADPAMRAQYVQLNDYEQIALKWKQFAVASNSPSAAAVASFADSVVANKQQAIALLQQTGMDSSAAFRAAKILGAGAGKVMLALDIAGAIQNGATDPDGMFSDLAGIALGGIVGGLLLGALGGVAGLLAMPVGAAVLAGLTVLAAGYAAAKIGEFIWDEFISDTFWDALDAMGIKEHVERFISMAGSAIGAVVPGTSDSPPYEVVHNSDGEVIASNEKENVVIGNDGSNDITMLHGRTVAFGKGGDDVFRVHTTAKGNQVISDAEGNNSLLFGIEDIGSLGLVKIGDNVYRSEGGNYTLTRVGSGDSASLVISSKNYEATVTILNWSNGNFGIELPGEPEPYEPPAPSYSGGAEADYISPLVGTPPPAGIVADGSWSRDMIWGTSWPFEDVLQGGDGDDIINGRGGPDRLMGDNGNDFISGIGDESIVHGGAGDDVIAADYNYGFNFDVGSDVPIDENGIWRDLHQYFEWMPASSFSLQDGELKLWPSFSLAGNFDHVGASVIGGGWSYRFWSINESRFGLTYFSPSSPDGEDGGSGVITFSDAGFAYSKGVRLYGESGNDTMIGTSARDFIDGGDDNDMLAGGGDADVIAGGLGDDSAAGGSGDDIMDGGEGADILHGEGGADTIAGGAGDDELWGDYHGTVTGTEEGNDYLDGGTGNDQISGQGGNDLLIGGEGNDFLLGGDGNDQLDGGTGEDRLQGGAGNDNVVGGNQRDLLFGEAGNDLLSGGEGNDQLQGGDGNDLLDGGDGDDLILGEADNDVLGGGAGSDELQGGAGNDALDGGEGNDRLFGQEGDDFLSGSAGDDFLRGNEGSDALSGGDGVDDMAGGDGNDMLEGGAGADRMWGEGGDDRMIGGAGNDYLDGDESTLAASQHGQDVIDGGDGDDVMHGLGGNDQVIGGDGNDLLFGDDYERVFSGDDAVHGGAGNDLVDGGAGNDLLKGDDGHDRLLGGDGDDVLDGGAGNDILHGGAGNDRFHFETDWGADQILGMDSAQAGTDTISFGEGVAVSSLFYQVHGQDLVITRNGTADAIYVYGYFGPGVSIGIQFADGGTISHEQLALTLGVGSVVGGTGGADTMIGTEEDDRLHGGDGDDTLSGLAGNDYLNGGAGNDLLIGGPGHDQMEGGTGNDVYQLDYFFGIDNVLNLDRADAGSDIIRFGPSLTRDMINNFQISGDDLMIAFMYGSPTNPDFDTVFLEGFLSGNNGTHIIEFADGSQLTASDFLSGAENWDGTEGADSHVGGNAANNLDGRGGNDTISGLGGNDRIYGGNGDDVLNGDDGDDMLEGGSGVDTLNGGSGNDQLYGKEYSNENADTLRGGAGDDRYYVGKGYQYGRSPDTVIELEGEGTDTVYADSYSYTLADNVENLVATYTSDYFYWHNPSYPGWQVDIPRFLTGNDLNNTIQLGDPSWSGSHNGRFYLLDGGAGADTLIGTGGNETYVVDQAGDVIVEPAQQGVQSIDTVRASYSYSLAWNVNLENVELSGSENLSAWGNAHNNRLDGSTSSGANTLAGGLGDDTYIITAKDVLVEAAGEGNDTVVISGLDETSAQGGWFDVSDYANVENLALGNNLTIDWDYDGSDNRGAFNANIRGNAGDNVLTGNGFRNEIRGGDGNDRIYGGERERNTVYDTSSDSLYGEGGDDTLYASSGGGDLHGGVGNDLLYGGGGHDNFHYAVGDGTDTIGSISGGSLDRVIFAEGIAPDDVIWSREGNDLIVQVGTDANDKLIVRNYWYEGGGLSWAVDQFVFADGTIRKGDLDRLPYTNNPPETLVGYVDFEAVGEEVFSYTLPAGMFADAADDTLQLSLGSNAPGWLSIDPVTGTITGTPPNGGDDLYVQIVATDSWGQTATSTLSLRVRNVLRGGGSDDILTGTDRRDDIYGYAGNDTLQGVGYADRLFGGSGDDTYIVDSDSHAVIELAGEGEDTVEATGYSYTLGDNVERLTLAEGSNATEGKGNAGDNVITGNAQNNSLDGGTGNDRLVGGLGDDIYTVDTAGDQVVEAAGEGEDTIQSAVGWQLGADIENLALLGSSNVDGLGNDLNNVLMGNDGNNRLEGGGGADELYGGWGDDYLILESSQDRAYEYEGEGLDTLERRYETNLILSDNIENLVLGAGVQSGNGNDLDNTVTGNAGNNRLAGLGGDDELLGLEGNDSMWGGDGADRLIGGAGDDYLDGSAGADHLDGGIGNDVYIVDDRGDLVDEAAGSGTDQVQTSASYAMSANIESMFLMGSGAINGTGNAQANYLAGNTGANVLNGMGGNDTIVGDAGNDTLIGGGGDDSYVVDADSGSDVVDNTGGGNDGLFFDGVARERLSFSRDGNDLLIKIDNGATPAVRVTSHFLGGDAAIDYVQPDGGSMLTTAQINQIVAGGGTGGQYDQVIAGTASGEQLVGNTGKDLIQGLAGDDQLFGMGGNDTLQGGDGADYLAGGNGGGSGSGNDRLEGGAGADTLTGEDGANALIGGAGDDDYVYGGGQDTIDNTGGGYDGVFFNNGITAQNLTFARDGDDLIVTVAGNATGFIRVTGHFLGGDSALDFVQPASGSLLDTASINALADPDDGGGNPGGGDNEGDDSDYPNVVTGTSAGEQLLGSSGRDLIQGLAGDDELFAFGGDDKLVGGDGADYLSGGDGSFSGSGSDILVGGAGDDTLVGEDGNDMLIGGAGDDFYYYATGSNFDTVDNVGGGTDWLYFADVGGSRLSYHQDGDDLVVLVDGDMSQGFRVLDHFLGGEAAIAYVQPSSGYAISAAQIANQLTPLPGNLAAQGGSSFAQTLSMSVQRLDATAAAPEAGVGMEGNAQQIRLSSRVALLTQGQVFEAQAANGPEAANPRLRKGHGPQASGLDYADVWSEMERWSIRHDGVGMPKQALRGRLHSSELDQLISAMAGFRGGEADAVNLTVHERHQNTWLATSVA